MPCDWSLTVSRSGQRVAAMRRRSSSISACGMPTVNGRIASRVAAAAPLKAGSAIRRQPSRRAVHAALARATRLMPAWWLPYGSARAPDRNRPGASGNPLHVGMGYTSDGPINEQTRSMRAAARAADLDLAGEEQRNRGDRKHDADDRERVAEAQDERLALDDVRRSRRSPCAARQPDRRRRAP